MNKTYQSTQGSWFLKQWIRKNKCNYADKVRRGVGGNRNNAIGLINIDN